MIENRPITTLFMLESVDGKISTGSTDDLDVDQNFINIDGVKEGLNQYYELEKNTDLVSLNTGRVMAKIGVNKRRDMPIKNPCTFVIIDNKPHIEEPGIRYICNWCTKLLLVTTNSNHPALSMNIDNLEVMLYNKLDLNRLLQDLKNKYDIDRITIQSGGNMNGLFLREKLIDYIDIVVAPILIGGSNTPTLIDGESIKDVSELNKLGVLKLEKCNVLNNSYIELKYKIIKEGELK